MEKFREKKRSLLFGLPLSFTTYCIEEELLKVKSGFFTIREEDCYLYKIQDVSLTRTLLERMFGLSTIICHTGDTTNPVLKIEHIKNAKAIKDFILETSEEARLKRRTLNTLDIGTGEMDEVDLAD